MSALQVQTQFDPNPGDTIQLFGGEYEFLANPKVSRFAYAVEGRKASVFKMKRRTGAEYALKVFRLAYRSNDSSRAFDALTRFSKLKGLTIAQRTLILPGSDEANHSPDLEYAVHMPWIASRTSLALLVPSVPIRAEWNVLLNPLHPSIAGLQIEPPQPFVFDARMFQP